MSTEMQPYKFGDYFTVSPLMRDAVQQAGRIFSAMWKVVLCGETGTGKGCVAEYLHGTLGGTGELGRVDLGAIPESTASDLLAATPSPVVPEIITDRSFPELHPARSIIS